MTHVEIGPGSMIPSSDNLPRTAFSLLGFYVGFYELIMLWSFNSHCGKTARSVTFNQQAFSDTYDILKLENNSVMGRSWKQIGTYLNNGSFQFEGNFLPRFNHIPSVTPEILRIVGIEHGQYLYKVGNVLGCVEQVKPCTRKTLHRRSLKANCEVGVPCYEHSKI